MKKRNLLLLFLFAVLCKEVSAAEGLTPIETANMYQGHGILSPWASFGKIAAALITIGFFIRGVVILKLAMTGEKNVTSVVWTLIGAAVGVTILRALV